MIVSCFVGVVSADDEAEIRSSFSALQASLRERKVDESVSLLSAKTREYYEMLSLVTQSADEKELSKLAPLNRMMVETLRNSVPPDFWRDKDPKSFLRRSILKGLVARELSSDLELGEIQVEGDRASAKISRAGKPSNLKLGFRREEGVWKVHLLSLFEQANLMTEMVMKKMGLNNEEFVRGLKERFGKK